jgi:hypothetical protein
LIRVTCSVVVSWERFNRATLIPSFAKRDRICLDDVAGPIVHTILVLVISWSKIATVSQLIESTLIKILSVNPVAFSHT